MTFAKQTEPLRFKTKSTPRPADYACSVHAYKREPHSWPLVLTALALIAATFFI